MVAMAVLKLSSRGTRGAKNACGMERATSRQRSPLNRRRRPFLKSSPRPLRLTPPMSGSRMLCG
eukprot:8268201-Alexandrium_andersonii.AAC.1